MRRFLDLSLSVLYFPLLKIFIFKNKKDKTYQNPTTTTQTIKLSIKPNEGWPMWLFSAFCVFRSSLLSLHCSTFLRGQSHAPEACSNGDLHHGQLCIVDRKQTTSITLFTLLQIAYPESFILLVPLSVVAQKVQLVLGRLHADLSFSSVLGFSSWLMKPHVSTISLVSVREFPLHPLPYINYLWSLTEACHYQARRGKIISFLLSSLSLWLDKLSKKAFL